jgi:hypothetical protein
MGTWLNVAFVQTDDVARVEAVLRELVVGCGRTLVTPLPRQPEKYDPMQYGKRDEVPRWAIAGFAGAPGWTVVRTAPLELLLLGDRPLLAELAKRVGAAAFQYNVYDGDTHVLWEATSDGTLLPPDPPLRFRTIDVDPVAAAAPREHVTGIVPMVFAASIPTEIEAILHRRRDALLRWLAEIGGSVDEPGARFRLYRVSVADVVRALGHHGDAFLSIEGVCDAAICAAFGGRNAKHCDNLFVVENLVPHKRLPVKGFVLYADRDVDR